MGQVRKEIFLYIKGCKTGAHWYIWHEKMKVSIFNIEQFSIQIQICFFGQTKTF